MVDKFRVVKLKTIIKMNDGRVMTIDQALGEQKGKNDGRKH